jgi:hypothetical protein
MAGDESSFCTLWPPQLGHVPAGGSENFWMISNVWWQVSQRYS